MPPAGGPIRVRVKKAKPTVVKPPAGDVASSGGNYGTKKAAPTVKRELHAIRVRQTQVKDVKSAKDLGRAKTYHKAHPEILKPPKKKKGGGLVGTALSTIGEVAAAQAALPLAAAATASDKVLGTKIIPGAKKAIRNAPSDVAELAVSTPSSLAKLGSDVVHRPEKVPGELIAPYKELLKHPGKFATEHPVSTALMLAPEVRGPGLVAGKVARVAGKQTLERTAATLPGTALKETRLGSRDVVVRKLQGRSDKKAGQRTMTVRQVQKRVDEAFGAQQKHRDRIQHAITKKSKADVKALPKHQREEAAAEVRAQADSAAKAAAERDFGREFGATAYRDKSGAIMKPKQATQGHLHDTREEAQAVADKLNRKPLTLEHGGFTKAERVLPAVLPAARKPVKVKFVVSQAGGKHAVYPDFVAKRLVKQRKVGTSMAPLAKGLRQSRSMFTRAVLPTRPTWLSGQAIEGTMRAAIHGAGPVSYLRARKVLHEMERQQPGSGKALLDRAVPAGKIGKVMKEFAGERKSFAEDFPGNQIAESLTSLGKTPGIKQVRDLYHVTTDAVFQKLNAQALEAFPQTVMLGRTMKRHPLMERRIVGLSSKAVEEAARGFRDTPTMNALARDVQRAYGKYSNFGPLLRETIMHWTPFIPWSLNAVRFLTTVLPADHPVLTALIADADQAEKDWLKAHRLNATGKNHLPFFDLGGYPTNGGKSVLRVGHYTPFGVGPDPSGGLADMVLPQFSGFYGAVKYGLDWKGDPLVHPDRTPYNAAEKWLYGLQQLSEAMIPLTQQTTDVARSGDPVKQLRHELRLLSSTRVKPKGQAKGLPAGLSQQDIDNLTKGLDNGDGLSQAEIDRLIGG